MRILLALLALAPGFAAATPADDLPIVCVTGASGFLGSELTGQLLETGQFRVRGTVRLLESFKAAPLRALKGAAERLELVQADLNDAGSFVACCEEATYVFHTASPFVTANIEDPHAQLVTPAVEGTINVLKAAAKAGVKRVVLTSSIAALMGGTSTKATCFDEGDWNDSSSLAGDGLDQYRYSKVMAERAAWDYVEREAPQLELATILPSFIVGPPRTPRTDSESLANMAALLEGSVPPRGDTPMADVRDVAAAHLAAATVAGAKGRRFIVSTASKVTRGEVMDAVRAAFPRIAVPPTPSAAAAAAAVPAGDRPVVFCSMTFAQLGVATTPPAESIVDMAAAMLRLKAVAPALRKDAKMEL